jgi:hypothetical protein
MGKKDHQVLFHLLMYSSISLLFNHVDRTLQLSNLPVFVDYYILLYIK